MSMQFQRNRKGFAIAMILILLSGLLPLHSVTPVYSQVANQVVISEVYGGGGNSGAVYKNDFVSLYNPTGQAVSLEGWSIQYASAAGTFNGVTPLSGEIKPYSYYLIKLGAGSGGTQELSVVDATGSINMSGSAGKVALANKATSITGKSDPAVVDYVGFGTTASEYEGSGSTPAPSNTKSVTRKSDASGIVVGKGNGWDTNDNAADFVVTDPNPKSSASPAEQPNSEEPPVTPPVEQDPTFMPIADARNAAQNAEVTIEGIVTHVESSTLIYIQDATGGIRIDTYTGNNTPPAYDLKLFNRGDKIKVKGTIGVHATETLVKVVSSENITPVSQNNPIPNPEVITLSQVGSHQGKLVKIREAKITNVAPDNFSFLINDATAELKLYHAKATDFDKANYVVDSVYDITGIAGVFNNNFQVKLRSGNDIVEPVTTPGVSSILDARALALGTEVTVEGIVTHAETATIMYIQDASAGIKIDTHGKSIPLTGFKQGQRVRIKGKLSVFSKELQITVELKENITVVSENNPLPTPKTITHSQLEQHQGQLVKVEMAKITDTTSASHSFKIEDMNKVVTTLYHNVAKNFTKTNYQKGQYVNVVGIAAMYNVPQIKLRDGADFVIQQAPQGAKLPIIYDVKPTKMQAVLEQRPVISGKIDEADGALNWSTFKLLVDGVDVTSLATIDQATKTFSYTPTTDLAYGEHSLRFEITDTTQAKNSYISYFYVQKQNIDQSLNYYFGVPHAHTAFSDGKGTPEEAYQMAKNNKLDYMIITDHSNWLEGDDYISDRKEYMEKVGSEWEITRKTAEAFNAKYAGEFLALRGFEMTSSNWGHVNVWNSSNYVEAKKTVTELSEFYTWLTKQENMVAAFNHPNWPSDSFNDLAYVPEVDHVMTMLEVGNGAPPYSYARAEEHFFRAMDNGWHVGAINGQDNHSLNFGAPDNLTAVIAEDLSAEAFIDAIKHRRVYSTEARDTKLRVKANGYWMGSTLDVKDGTALNFDIWVQDNNDPIDEIQIISNGGKILTSTKVGDKTEFSWNPVINDGDGANWYVVKVIHSNAKWTTASAIFTSGGEQDVKLTNLTVNPDPSVPGSETKLIAQISNMGVRDVSNLEVTFYRGSVASENRIGNAMVSYVGPGQKANAEVTWVPTTSGQDKIIAVLTEIPNVTTVTKIEKSIKVVESIGKKVLVDAAHQNADVPGSMNDFMELLRRYGYTAVYNYNPITSASLEGYDVLVINAPAEAKPYTDAEMTAISNWVKAGGSLMYASKSNFSYNNTTLNPMLEKMGSGIRINSDNVYEPNTSKNFSGGMKWSVYARTMPSSISGLNDNLEAIRYFSGASLVNAKLGPLVNNPETGLEILVAGNKTSYNFNVQPGYHTYNEAIGGENDANQTSGPNGEKIPLVAKEYVGEGRIIVAGRHFYSDYEIVNDVSNTSFTLKTMDWLAKHDRTKSIKQVRDTAKEGDIVTVMGVVTAPTNKFFDTVYIQDETGGIALYGSQGRDLPVGTVVIATGGITYFEGELELAYENFDMEILYVGPGSEVQAKSVTAKQVSDGTFNGQLVELKGTITEINSAGSFMMVNDGKSSAIIHTDGYLPLGLDRFKENDYISVKGISSSGASGNRIRVRFADDLAFATKPQTDFDLTVMHTNDTHARLDNVAKRVTAVKEIRSEGKNNILLDAGDVFSGSLWFNVYEGLADLQFMNMMGYDAMVPGNHEFDLGPTPFSTFVSKANFPIVSANIDYSNNAELNSQFVNTIGKPGVGGKIYPAIILEVDGEQVGVFGLTTEDTSFISNPGSTIRFENHLTKAQATVDMLKAEGVNKIIALTHLGFNMDKLLAESVSGIDIIVGGHSHTQVNEPVVFNTATEPTVVVQAKEYNEFLGRLDVTFDPNGVLKVWNGKLIELKNKAEDPEAKALLDTLKPEIDAIKSKVVGSTAVELDGKRDNVRSQETNLGNLIADAYLSKAQEYTNASISIINGGGIRSSIKQGTITLGDVQTVMPFGNSLVTLELTGKEIVEALENGVSDVANKGGRFPQVSGLSFWFDATLPVGERVSNVQVKTATGFQPIQENQKYTVATLSFLADGGDGYNSFKKAKSEGRITELFFVDFEVFTEYLSKGEVNPKVEGRITQRINVTKTITETDKEVSLPNGVTLNFTQAKFEGAAPVTVNVVSLPKEDAQIAPSSFGNGILEVAGSILDIDTSSPFKGTFEIKVPVDPNLSLAEKNRLGVYYYNSETQKWEYQATRLSEDKSYLIATASKLSIYGVLRSNDMVAPITKIELQGTELASSKYLHQVSVKLSASDNTMVHVTEYSLDNGSTWKKYLQPFDITKEGETTILYRSRDVAGNLESVKSVKVTIVSATLSNVEQMINNADANKGMKTSTLALLDKVRKELDRNKKDNAYTELKKVRDHLAKMKDQNFSKADREAILKVIDYILKEQLL